MDTLGAIPPLLGERAGVRGAVTRETDLTTGFVIASLITSNVMTDVAAGLVFRDGRLLITQRPAGGHLAGLWEFPGGKRHDGETWVECLRRELREELGIEIEIGEVIEELTHTYPEKTVHLKFFRCGWRPPEPQPLGCPAFVWVTREELSRYDFPAADARLLDALNQHREWWQADISP